MRRYFVLTGAIVAVIGMITAVFATLRGGDSEMPIFFHKRDLPEDGIRIITPLDPSFDVKALKYFKKTSLETLKPFSVFIENSSTKTLVAYTLTWRFGKDDGQITSNTVGYSEPGVLMGDATYEGPNVQHTVPIKYFSWMVLELYGQQLPRDSVAV